MSFEDGLFFDEDSDESFFIGYKVDSKLLNDSVIDTAITSRIEYDANDSFLIMDLKNNRNSRKLKNLILKYGLNEQFDSLNLNDNFEDFFRINFLSGPVDCFISHPSFEKKSEHDEFFGRTSINNVALRFNKIVNGRDLILMSDLDISPEIDGRIKYIFYVKYILVMDADITHYGEILVKNCSVVLRLCDNWEDPENSNYSELQEKHQSHNIINNNFIARLLNTYVVPNPDEVIHYLNKWKEYLNYREYLINESSKQIYRLAKAPEAIVAYETRGHIDDVTSKVEFLKVKNKTWTTEEINPKSRTAVLAHLCTEVSLGQHNTIFTGSKKKNTLKKQFDAFIKKPLRIIDTNNLENNIPRTVFDLGDSIVGTESFYEIIEPEEDIREIENDKEVKLEEYKIQLKNDYQNNCKKLLEGFERDELPGLIEKFRMDNKESVRTVVIMERKKKRDDEEKRLRQIIENNRSSISSYQAQIDKQKTVLDMRMAELDGYNKLLETEYSGELNKKQKREKSDLTLKISENKKKIRNISQELTGYEEKKASAQTAIDSANAEICKLEEEGNLEELVKSKLDRNCLIEKNRLLREKEQEIAAYYNEENERLFSEYKKSIEEDADKQIEERKDLYTRVLYHAYFEIPIETKNANDTAKDFNELMKEGLSLQKNNTGDLTVIRREREALDKLFNGEVVNPFLATALFSPNICEKSHHVERIDHYYQDNLNEVQKEAVAQALSSNGMFLIQGPPGTGKTQVIAEITTQFVKRGKKVLIASENNKAVDNAFSRLHNSPDVRAVRLFSDSAKNKEDNEFNLKSLTKNLYHNIGDTLKRRIDNYDNIEKYQVKIDDDIAILKDIRGHLAELENKISVIKANIAEIDDSINELYLKIDKSEKENYKLESSIEDANDAIADFKNFEDDLVIEEIKKIFAENNIATSELFDPSLMKLLYEVGKAELTDEYGLYEENKELFDLNSRKKSALKNEIIELSREIQRYESEKGISLSDFKIMDRFRNVPLYEELIEAKKIIDSIVDEKIAKKKSQIDRNTNNITDNENKKHSIQKLKQEKQKLSDDVRYREYEELKKTFNRKSREILNDLSIPLTSTDDDVIDLLELERNRILRESNDNENNKIKALTFKTLVNYIESDYQIKKDSEKYNPMILNLTNVFGITCSSNDRFSNIFDNKKSISLDRLNIDVVIIDEVSKLTFVELLRPILMGKTILLVGDHRQLPPMFPDKIADEEIDRYDEHIINKEIQESYRSMIEDRSFFEELFEKTPDSNKTMLLTQYRMHKDIMEIDNLFYNNKLKCGCGKFEKEHYMNIRGSSGINILSERDHILFVNCLGKEEMSSGSNSFHNDAEKEVVVKLLEVINDSCSTDRNGQPIKERGHKMRGDNRMSVGVICTYSEQVKMIKNDIRDIRYDSFNQSGDDRLMVSSVDNFQGDERDIIILSMVRTKGKSSFLENYHRINVAISRARRLLIIVGNMKPLLDMKMTIDGESKPVFKQMIDIIQRSDGVISAETIVGGSP